MTTAGGVLVHPRFGRFLLDPVRRSLTADGYPVALNARAFDLLLLLVERRDQIVSKDDLRALVWRGMAVDDNNLAVQISVLRRALGEKPGGARFILTVPGRGYQFVAPVEGDTVPEIAAAPTVTIAPGEQPSPQAAPHTMPGRRRRLIQLAAAATLSVAAAGGWFAAARLWPAQQAPRLSIAVLPFRNLGGDPNQDYLADAISDDLTTDLAHIPDSTVIARASADTFRSRTDPAAAIGRALNVRYLLEGSLRPEGERLHINAQLIDAPSGAHLWAEAFDVDRDRLGTARTAIVRRIASALDFTLTGVEGARSLHDRPENADAVDFYLRARSIISRGNSLASLTEAQALLERSVAADPNNNEALAQLGLVLLHKIAGFDDPAELLDRMRAQDVITRALALAPRNATAITAGGALAMVDGHCNVALTSFRLALSINTNDVQARNGEAVCAGALGRMNDMIDDLQDLIRIDPASPANARMQHLVGMGYLMLGKPADALPWFERAGVGLSDSGREAPKTLLGGWKEWRRVYLIAATQMLGDHAAAEQQYAAYSRIYPHRTVWRLRAYASRAQTALPGSAAYAAALHAAGMPFYTRQDEDFHVAVSSQPREEGDFAPTPTSLPGTRTIDTAGLHALLLSGAKPLVLDGGHGAATIPGAILTHLDGGPNRTNRVAEAMAEKAGPGTAIVVMSDGVCGWESYNTVLALLASGFHSVLWYRGGEEAWAAAGYPAEDRRPS